jgi:hypothetical protein
MVLHLLSFFVFLGFYILVGMCSFRDRFIRFYSIVMDCRTRLHIQMADHMTL